MAEHQHENANAQTDAQQTEPADPEQVDSGNKVEVEEPGDAPGDVRDDDTEGDAQDDNE